MRLAANLFAALLVLLTAQAGSAQSNYPNRPVKILVGFTPGTAPDLAARILADRFAEVWGTPFVVENLPGAGSNIATERVAKAAADGYTLLMGGNSALVINPSLYEQLPFDPVKDFAPISQVFIAANVLAVPPTCRSRPWRNWWRSPRREPGKLSYGHAGVGTSQHLGAELFKYMAQCRYRVGAVSRHHGVHAGPARQPHHHVVRQYRQRAAAGARREIARAGHHLDQALGAGAGPADHGGIRLPRLRGRAVVRPARAIGTPKDVLDKLHGETVKALAMPEVRKKFDELGLEPIGNTPAEFAAVIKKETPEWAKVIKDAGIKLGN